jgi:MFS family permease
LIINNQSISAVISLLLARIFYSVNWFNISSMFYLIAADFKQDISMLGFITAAFYIGIGLFQVPAGILAAKYGPKRIAIYGIIITSSAALLSGLAVFLLQITTLRFIVGLGMALFFGPSVILISKYLGKGSEGYGVGLLNSAHALGGIIGIFGWIVIAQLIGWRMSIVLGGLLGLTTAFILYIVLSTKKEKEGEEKEKKIITHSSPSLSPYFKVKLSDIQNTLSNRSLIILGVILLGFQISSTLTSTFTVYYLNQHLNVNPIIAGLIGSLPLIMALAFSSIFGKVYDRAKDAKKLLIILGTLGTLSIAGIATDVFYIVIVSIVTASIFMSGGFVIVYARAKQVNELKPEYQPLAVSFVNGIGLFGGFWVPMVFSIIVTSMGYNLAWLFGSLFSFALIIVPILRLK